MKDEKIISCLGCTTEWHMKNPTIHTKHLYQCPMCMENEYRAKKVKNNLKLRKVRKDKKSELQHRKANRKRVARFRDKKKDNFKKILL